MAANSSSRGIASFGKRVADQIWTRSSLSSSVAVASRRAVHTSTYDKNLDEHSHPSHVVPDELIQPNSDKYWAPDPQTGVFGPAAAGHASAAGGGRGFQAAAAAPEGAGEGSVLEQKAWFRPTSIEDLEKPATH